MCLGEITPLLLSSRKMPLACLPLSTLGGKVKTVHREGRHMNNSGFIYDLLLTLLPTRWETVGKSILLSVPCYVCEIGTSPKRDYKE